MRSVCLFLALFALALPARAELEFAPAAQNVIQQQDDISKFLESLSTEKPRINPRSAAATIKAAGKVKIPKGFWAEGTEDPYKRAEALKAAKAMGGCGLASVGSSMAGEMADQLMAAGAQMIATGDPQFSSIGQSLQQESAAVSSGNRDAAQTLADQVNAEPLPDLSNYSPSPSDMQYASAAQQATAQMAGAVLTAVGTIAGAVIGAYCSGGTGTAAGAMYGAALGSMAGSAIGNAIDGSNSDTSSQIANLGVQAVNQGAQTAQTKLTQSGNVPAQTNTLGQQTVQNAGTGSATGAAPTGAAPIAGQATSNNTGALAGSGTQP